MVTFCNIFIDAAVSHVIQQDLVICYYNIIVLVIIDVTLQTQPHPLRITLFGRVIHHTVEVLGGFGTPFSAHLFDSWIIILGCYWQPPILRKS